MLASSPSTQGESDFSAQGKPSDSIRSDFALGHCNTNSAPFSAIIIVAAIVLADGI